MSARFRLSVLAAACAAALALPAFAQQPPMQRAHSMRMMAGQGLSAEERQAMAKKHLQREAAMLEIKASQQPAWEVYAAAKLDLMAAFGGMPWRQAEAGGDAATLARQHADRAAVMAQKLSVLADATEKLQAVLGEDQRKVLDRLAQHHGGMRDGSMCGQRHGMRQGRPGLPGTPAAKAQPQK